MKIVKGLLIALAVLAAVLIAMAATGPDYETRRAASFACSIDLARLGAIAEPDDAIVKTGGAHDVTVSWHGKVSLPHLPFAGRTDSFCVYDLDSKRAELKTLGQAAVIYQNGAPWSELGTAPPQSDKPTHVDTNSRGGPGRRGGN